MRPLVDEARTQRIRALVRSVIRRRIEGESVNESELMAVHADLMPELAERLVLAASVERARGDSAANSQAPAEAAEDLPQIPGFAVVRLIAEGGQGWVYQAEQQGTGQRVAIKVMREAVRTAGAAGRQLASRLDREARILGELEHPGVVPLWLWSSWTAFHSMNI